MSHTRLSSAVIVFFVVMLLAGCGGGGPGPSVDPNAGRIVGSVGETSLSESTRATGEQIIVCVEGTDLCTHAQPDGSFAIDGVPPGVHTLVAKTESRAIALVVEVTAGRETNVGRMVLSDAGQISGLVTSTVNGLPISEAQVTVTARVDGGPDVKPYPVWFRLTDGHGSYTVSGLPVGECLVNIVREGFESVSLVLYVNSGSTTPSDASLNPLSPTESGAVAGKVYASHNGEFLPLPGAMVYLAIGIPPDPFGMPIMPSPVYYAYTGPDGSYKIEGARAGEYIAVASRLGFEQAQQQVVVKANETATVDFTLALESPRYGTIEGTVTDAVTHLPIAGAEVWAVSGIVWLSDAGVPRTRALGGIILPPQENVMWTRTDAQGRYRLVVPPEITAAGVYTLGYPPKESPVTVQLGGTVTLNFTLDPPSRSEVILAGKVTRDVGGQPLSGVLVRAVPTDHDWSNWREDAAITARTNAEGNYRLNLKPGYYVVSTGGSWYSAFFYLTLYEDAVQDIVASNAAPPPPPGM